MKQLKSTLPCSVLVACLLAPMPNAIADDRIKIEPITFYIEMDPTTDHHMQTAYVYENIVADTAANGGGPVESYWNKQPTCMMKPSYLFCSSSYLNLDALLGVSDTDVWYIGQSSSIVTWDSASGIIEDVTDDSRFTEMNHHLVMNSQYDAQRVLTQPTQTTDTQITIGFLKDAAGGTGADDGDSNNYTIWGTFQFDPTQHLKVNDTVEIDLNYNKTLATSTAITDMFITVTDISGIDVNDNIIISSGMEEKSLQIVSINPETKTLDLNLEVGEVMPAGQSIGIVRHIERTITAISSATQITLDAAIGAALATDTQVLIKGVSVHGKQTEATIVVGSELMDFHIPGTEYYDESTGYFTDTTHVYGLNLKGAHIGMRKGDWHWVDPFCEAPGQATNPECIAGPNYYLNNKRVFIKVNLYLAVNEDFYTTHSEVINNAKLYAHLDQTAYVPQGKSSVDVTLNDLVSNPTNILAIWPHVHDHVDSIRLWKAGVDFPMVDIRPSTALQLRPGIDDWRLNYAVSHETCDTETSPGSRIPDMNVCDPHDISTANRTTWHPDASHLGIGDMTPWYTPNTATPVQFNSGEDLRFTVDYNNPHTEVKFIDNMAGFILIYSD